MKIAVFSQVNGLGSRRGFTMVEIALSIAIVALGMVAIMGVLPTGMTVEKDNREDILISQEGQYWIEVIKSGSRGARELTNYVERIIISNIVANAPVIQLENNKVTPLQPEWIVGLLSSPKWAVPDGLPPFARRVTAITKPITGPAAEKGGLTNEFGFRYAVEVALTQPLGDLQQISRGTNWGHQFLPPNYSNLNTNDPLQRVQKEGMEKYAMAMATSLQEIRVTLRWPLYERGSNWVAGSRKKVFRAQLSGTLEERKVLDVTPGLPLPGGIVEPLYFIRQNYYKQHVSR